MIRDRRLLAATLAFSLLLHGVMLGLTFGGDATGLPGFGLPWQERRAEVPEVSVVLAAAAPRTASSGPAAPASAAADTNRAQKPDAPRPAPLPEVEEGRVLTLALSEPNAPNAPDAPAAKAVVSSQPPRPGPRIPTSPQTAPTAAVAEEDTLVRIERPRVVPPAPPSEPALMTVDRADATALAVPSAAPVAAPALAPAPTLAPTPAAAASSPPATIPATDAVTVARADSAERNAQAREDQRRAQAEAAQVEAARAEAARVKADRDRSAAAAKLESARLDAERARLETERDTAARLAAARAEALRLDADRQAASQAAAAKLEASRIEAARVEAARLEAARVEAARLEAARAEAARMEATRAEAAKLEAAKADLARQEASRVASLEADEARRNAVLRAIGRQLDEEAARRDAATPSAGLTSRLAPSSGGARRGRLFGRSDPNAELVLYAEAWARKIQLNMTMDLVRDAAKQPYTDPLVTVAVRSDGTIESVTFVLSSGVPAIDDAIRRIVQSQVPYPAFQPALAREYDVVEIRRNWHFDSSVRLY